jgi:hypothetical protein
LPDHTEPEVPHPRGLDHLRALQFDPPGPQVVKEPDALPEQGGNQVNPNLVDQPGLDGLLRDVGAAHPYVPVPRDRFRLLDGALDAVCDEGEGDLS